LTDQPVTQVSKSRLSITALAKYTLRAWFMSLRSEEIIVVNFVTANGSQICFAEFLRGRKLP
jgi:hypothetical protein